MPKCKQCNAHLKCKQRKVVSLKFDAMFCTHKCYVAFRKDLDPTWKDEPYEQQTNYMDGEPAL